MSDAFASTTTSENAVKPQTEERAADTFAVAKDASHHMQNVTL